MIVGIDAVALSAPGPLRSRKFHVESKYAWLVGRANSALPVFWITLPSPMHPTRVTEACEASDPIGPRQADAQADHKQAGKTVVQLTEGVVLNIVLERFRSAR